MGHNSSGPTRRVIDRETGRPVSHHSSQIEYSPEDELPVENWKNSGSRSKKVKTKTYKEIITSTAEPIVCQRILKGVVEK